MRWTLVIGTAALLLTAGAQGAPAKEVEAAPATVTAAPDRVAGNGLSMPSEQPLRRVEVAALREGLRGDPFAAAGAGQTPQSDAHVPAPVEPMAVTPAPDDKSSAPGARWAAWLIGLLGIVWFTGRRRRVP